MQAAKTNVMRVFDAHKFGYECFTYTADPSMSGVDVACEIGLDADSVFKTLVARCRSGKICVFMVPVAKELDLKKAALVSGEKSVSMLKSKELLGVTGYVHGGCSPVGMKKIFDTYIDESAAKYERITFSAGRIGTQLRVRLSDLMKVAEFRLCDLAK